MSHTEHEIVGIVERGNLSTDKFVNRIMPPEQLLHRASPSPQFPTRLATLACTDNSRYLVEKTP